MTGLIQSSRTPRARFLIVAFVAMLAMQVFAVVASGVNTRRTELDNAERSIMTASDRQMTAVTNFLQPAERITDDTVDLLQRNIVSDEISTHGAELEGYLFTRLSSVTQASAAYVGLADGSFISVSRRSADDAVDDVLDDGIDRGIDRGISNGTEVDGFVATRFTGAGGPRSQTVTSYDEQFNVISSETTTLDDSQGAYDPTGRPWYSAAARSEGLVWNDPYEFFTSSDLGVTVSRALRSGDTVQAVVGVDVKLSGLSQFIDPRNGDAHEDTYVVSNGRVIAAPIGESLVTSRDADSPLGLRTPADFGLAFTEDTDTTVGHIRMSGVDTLVAHRDFPRSSVADWEIIVRASESAYTDSASTQQRLTLVLSIGGALMLAVALLVMWRVTNPITKLQEEASTDPLTGLANRRTISAVGQTMLRDLRQNERLAVLTLDLDEFKELNDRLGHHIGDHALVVVAETLTALTRRGDLVGRLGGDEFVVALPVHDLRDGTEIVNRIMQRLTDALHRSVPHAELGVTGGMTMSHDDVFDFDELLIEADIALLQAKAEAKGMMMVAERVVTSSVRTRR